MTSVATHSPATDPRPATGAPLTRPATRAPLSRPERGALAVLGAGTAALGTYGFATGAPSTVAYVCTVAAVAWGVLHLRRSPLPGPLAVGLAALAVAHLAGGLVRVGDGVLYNATAGSEALRYDHLVHSSGVFAGTLAVWALFAPALSVATGRRAGVLALWVLGGLGLGAVNETVEFVVTLLHHASQVGGYENTGWDLVSNVAGASAAAWVIARRPAVAP